MKSGKRESHKNLFLKQWSKTAGKTFFSFVEWFVSPDVLAKSGYDINRARIVIGYLMIIMVFGIGFSGIYFWLDSPGASIAPLLGLPVATIFLFIIKRKGAIGFVGNLFIAFLSCVFFSISYFTGGFNAPVVAWFAILPLIAFISTDSKSGFIWCFLIIFVHLGYFFLHKTGFHFQQDLGSSEVDLIRLLALVGFVLLIYLFLQILEYSNRRTTALIKSREIELQRIQKAVDESSDAIGVFSPTGMPFYLNKRYKEVFGLNAEDENGETRVYSHFANQQIADEIGNTIQLGKSWFGETEVISTDIKRIQALSRVDAVRDENKEIIAYIGAHTDITQQKEVEGALKESEERYRFLMENVTDAIWIRDLDLKLSYVSPSIERIRGFSPEEVLKQSLEDIMTPESLKKVSEVWETKMENFDQQLFKEIAIEVQLYHKDGSIIWAEINAGLIRDKNGTPNGWIGVTRDITERKDAESKLEAAQKELIKNAHQAGMAEIAADTLHNAGNLMNSIKTSAHLIQRTIANSALFEMKRANDLIRENIDNLEDFIIKDGMGRKILEYYLALENKMEDEHKEVVENIDRLDQKIGMVSNVISAQQTYAGLNLWIEKCSLLELIEDALVMQSVSLESYHVQIFRKFDEVPNVAVQKTKLVHVLINLIQNAVEAMAETPLPKRSINLVLKRLENVVRFEIEDAGIGIRAENQIKIFTHGFTTRKDGHGFGLHSCANYMSEMNGKIWVESDGENQGARFYLDLPIEQYLGVE